MENQSLVIAQDPLPADVPEISSTVIGNGGYDGSIPLSGIFNPCNYPDIAEFEDITLKVILNAEVGGLIPVHQFNVLSDTSYTVLESLFNVLHANKFYAGIRCEEYKK